MCNVKRERKSDKVIAGKEDKVVPHSFPVRHSLPVSL